VAVFKPGKLKPELAVVVAAVEPNPAERGKERCHKVNLNSDPHR
jgi:hypothetical protein